MKILAIDIGAGTQDILLFDSDRTIENCSTLVLPTPSRVFAARVRKMAGDLYIYGDTIGGGSIGRAVQGHLKKGYRVVMSESAAYSIRNDLEEVRSMGIEVGENPSPGKFQELEIKEIDLPLLQRFLTQFGEDFDFDVIAVAVQDHGVAPKGVSDRAFRFEQMEARLREDNRPESIHFTEDSIPSQYLRMRSAAKAVKRASPSPVIVMDTAFSAILGCLNEAEDPCLVVNVGNGHTMAALLIEGKIEGLYEHHTHRLTPKKLEDHLRRFLRGELTQQEVFEDEGHGVITLTPHHEEVRIWVTGPNRNLFKETSFRYTFAAPGGNTMMTGPLGLIKAAQNRFGIH
ncbi:MAG: DUF1786 domain-containing protein [Desulfobacterota bacterium]|nr:DUF1786 domain-containing protein [Thermodesulfobacteriota bacterium]